MFMRISCTCRLEDSDRNHCEYLTNANISFNCAKHMSSYKSVICYFNYIHSVLPRYLNLQIRLTKIEEVVTEAEVVLQIAYCSPK